MPSPVKPLAISPINRAVAEGLGVIALFFFRESGSARAYDEITGANVLSGGGTAIDTEGIAYTFNGSQQNNLAFVIPTYASANTPLVCARIKATATQAANPGSAFGLGALTGTQSGVGVGFDTSNNVGIATMTGGGSGLASFSAGSQNVWYTVFAQCIAFGGSGACNAWINGTPATTQGTVATGGVATLNELAFGAQHRSAGFLRQFKGNIEWAAVIDTRGGAFTDAQAAALYASDFPYNLLVPRKLKPWWQSSGAAPAVPPYFDMDLCDFIPSRAPLEPLAY